eukprot:m.45819 g.45819  ORF g.45819 m.45819 type:complete len:534 (+) comp20065_c0_seq3:226-1827(+)
MLLFPRVILLGLFLQNAFGSSRSPANIILVMSDDQDGNLRQDWTEHFPTHKYLKDNGASFPNHVADAPQCGPSRASTLSGRLPHNNGFLENGDASGASIRGWMRYRNNTIGSWLSRAGYHTGFIGKWVNGDGCPNGQPLDALGAPTWTYFAMSCNTYVLYNTSYFDAASPTGQRIETGIHQSDSIGNQAIAQMNIAVSNAKPFYLHLTPVAPHESTCNNTGSGGYPEGGDNYGDFGRPCPAFRHRGLFLNLSMPHLPNWNHTSDSPVSFNKWTQPISSNLSLTIDQTWRVRLQALMSVDEMVGRLITEIKVLGIEHNTYLIYTSDNGYHLGEHLLPPFNKREPYQSDVQLPMYMIGPGISRGSVVSNPTQHVDLAMTIVDIASAQSVAPINELDGMSVMPLLTAQATSWRPFSFSQFHENCNTWLALRLVNASDTLTFRLWCTNETEMFDLIVDPYELHNLAAPGLPHNGRLSQLRRQLLGVSTCKGDTCRNSTAFRGDAYYPKCYLGLCTHKPNYGECGHYSIDEPQRCQVP